MFSFLGNVLKYSGLVLLVLVLSHIIQVKGVSISRHVENSMNWISGSSPRAEVTKVTQELSSSVSHAVKNIRSPNSKPSNGDSLTEDDQRQLNHLILRSQKK